MTTCKNSATTETGTFTFYSEPVTRCEAKKRCKRRGQVLAPIKTMSDFNAIRNVMKANNQDSDVCLFNLDFNLYHVGLEVENIGGKLVKTWSDGTWWDKCEDYVSMYRAGNNKMTCPTTVFVATNHPKIKQPSLKIVQNFKDCSPDYWWYICLDTEKKSVSESLVAAESKGENFQVLGTFAAISLLVNIVCAVVVVSMKRSIRS